MGKLLANNMDEGSWQTVQCLGYTHTSFNRDMTKIAPFVFNENSKLATAAGPRLKVWLCVGFKISYTKYMNTLIYLLNYKTVK